MTVSGLALGHIKKYESTTVGRQEIVLRKSVTLSYYIYIYILREREREREVASSKRYK